nr:leucine-rich repeat-containing protein [Tanacetum cinerariifolium]
MKYETPPSSPPFIEMKGRTNRLVRRSSKFAFPGWLGLLAWPLEWYIPWMVSSKLGHLNGTFPGLLGDLLNLQALVLKSNNFHGHIQPSATIEFPFLSLRVLDLSHNGIKPEYLYVGGKYYSFVVAVKGVNQDFPQISVKYTIIDLSNNTFEGQIPNVIGRLNSLIVLNLSHNNLIGEIPQSIAHITTLEVLNVSQNHLVGRIPEGPQFSTFGTSFGGNSGLYRSPLPKREHQSSPQVRDNGEYDDGEESGFTWKVVTLGYGCGTLVELVMGYLMLPTRIVNWFNAIADAAQSLVLKKKRRHIYREMILLKV